ncbi:KilA-N domain-containing protein [Xenorhabdus sp. TH1]|uniref:KilA-N domain-containing protein n=1 Tax=Xenorhabdus sp. TH1 TaxID=3130166 RepID=UPI0030CD55E3
MNYPTIVIENIQVRSSEHGTYNLNDLHKAAIAAGLAQKWQKPSQFLQSDGIREFVEEVTKVLKHTLEQNQILRISHGGNERGTWAHELITLRYAAWLSPAFEVKVYQTFRAVILGQLGKFAQANRLELEYQSKKRRVSTAARIMNSWGVGGEKQRIESDRELLAKEIQFSIPGLEEVKS